MPFHRLPLCARCCGCSLQSWVVIIGFIHGCLVTVALIHFCIVTMNHKKTQAERNFVRHEIRDMKKKLQPLLKQYNASANRICDQVGGNSSAAAYTTPKGNKSVPHDPSLPPPRELPRPTQLPPKLRRHLSGNNSSKENIAVWQSSNFNNETAPRHSFIYSKDVSSIQILLNNSNQYQPGKYLDHLQKEQQPLEAAELTKRTATQYPKSVSLGEARQRRRSQTVKHRGLAYWAKMGLSLKLWPWGENRDLSRIALYRNMQNQILKQLSSIQVRADDKTDAANGTDPCHEQAKQDINMLKLILKSAIQRIGGDTKDSVKRVCLPLQAIGVVLCVASLVTICMLIIGVAELDSRLMVPWMTAVAGFFIFMFYYMYIELFLYTADPIMTAGTFILMFVVFLFIAILLAVAVYVVFCLYWLLFTPEGYISKQEAVAQVIVSGRDFRY